MIKFQRQQGATYFTIQRIALLIFLLSHSLLPSCRKNWAVRASQAAGTETLVGIVGQDFVLIGADSSVSQSIALTASNLDKIAVLVDPFPYHYYDHKRDADGADEQFTNRFDRQQTIVAAAAGDAADADRLVGILQAHATIQEYESSVGCDVEYYDVIDDGDNATFKDGGGETISRSQRVSVYAEPGLTVEGMANLARGQIANALRSRSPLQVCLLIAGMMPVTSVHRTYKQEMEEHPQERTSYAATPAFVSLQQQVRQASWKDKAPADTTAKQNEHGSDGVEMSDEMVGRETSPSTSSLYATDNPVGLEPRLFWLDEYGSLQQIQYGAHGYGSNFVLSILDQGFRDNLTREEAVSLLRNCFQQLRTRYVINSPQPPCIKCVDARGCYLIR